MVRILPADRNLPPHRLTRLPPAFAQPAEQLQDLFPLRVGQEHQEIAGAVSAEVQGWFDLLTDVVRRAAERFGSLGPFSPEELAALAGLPFLGAEAVILLGLDESKIAARPALRKIGELLRLLEEPPEPGGQ